MIDLCNIYPIAHDADNVDHDNDDGNDGDVKQSDDWSALSKIPYDDDDEVTITLLQLGNPPLPLLSLLL